MFIFAINERQGEDAGSSCMVKSENIRQWRSPITKFLIIYVFMFLCMDGNT
jgi:hypothetical protein